MSNPIAAPCFTDYRASRHSGTRPLDQVKLIVWHDTEGGTAKSVAQYFGGPIRGYEPGGSAHLVIDDNTCYRCLRNDQVPWGAQGANRQGFHIEQCGYARWTPQEWKEHIGMLERVAFKTALHCTLFEIPLVFLHAEQLKLGHKGITTHAECSKAFGGNHTDPGPGYPWQLTMRLVRKHFAALKEKKKNV